MNSPAGIPAPVTAMPTARPAVDWTGMVALLTVIEGATEASWFVFCVRMREPPFRLNPLPKVFPENVSVLVPAVTPVPVVRVMVLPVIVAMDSPAGMPVPDTAMPTASPFAFVTVNVLLPAVVVALSAMDGASTSDPVPAFTSAPAGVTGTVTSKPFGERPEVVIVLLGSIN